MPHRILNFNFPNHSPIIQLNCQCVPDGPLLRVVVVDAVGRLFDAGDFGAEGVDAGVGGLGIGAKRIGEGREGQKEEIIGGRMAHLLRFAGQFAEDEGVGHHVVDVMAKTGI